MIIICPPLSCLTLPIVVSFVTCLFIVLLNVFCLHVIHSCILCHAFLSDWGFQKGLIVWCIFFFGWKGLGTGRNWVHILGIWGLFKLVNIRWFFYVLFIYISGLFHYYRYGWRVLSLYFFFAIFSFDCLLEKKKKKKLSFVVLIVKIYTLVQLFLCFLFCTYSISHHLRHCNFHRLQQLNSCHIVSNMRIPARPG